MNPIWFVRMTRWARNPPSPGRIALVFGIIAVLLMIWGIEKMGWWPEWATATRARP